MAEWLNDSIRNTTEKCDAELLNCVVSHLTAKALRREDIRQPDNSAMNVWLAFKTPALKGDMCSIFNRKDATAPLKLMFNQ